MKKLLTFLFMLTVISFNSFGQGNLFVWDGGGDGVTWTDLNNWDGPYALPYGEAGGTSTWPGQNANGDYAVFNDGGYHTGVGSAIVGVPDITLGRFEILPVPGTTNLITAVELNGLFDGATITLRTPSAQIIAEATQWILKIEAACELYMNVSGARVKLVAQPRAHVWQKDGEAGPAIFDPAQYTDCDGQKGFLLMDNGTWHAEFIQQVGCNQPVKGWVQVVLDDNKHHYISSPIETVWPLDAEFGNVNEFCRRHNTICVFEGDYVRKYDNSTGWDVWLGNCMPLLTNTVINFDEGRGYHFYGNAGNPYNNTGVYEMYGPFWTGGTADPISLYVTGDEWNLVGNPYASAIMFGEPSGQPTAGEGWEWDLTKIEPLAWYWDNNLGVGGAYHNYNWYTGVGNGPVDERRILARSQGFFVYVKQGSYPAEIKVNNKTRFFRGTFNIGKSAIANYLTLELSANGNYLDDAIIGFRNDATDNNFNGILDNRKLFNENNSQLYVKTVDDVIVAAKTLPIESGSVMHPVYLKVKESGSYTITAKDLDAFSANTSITLRDNKTQTDVNLQSNPVYTFNATAGDDDARFSLYFANVAYGINDLSNNSFKVYSHANTIYIQNNELTNINGTAIVYDMIGKQMTQVELNGSITKINTSFNAGFYVVSVKTDSGVYNQKVYIN